MLYVSNFSGANSILIADTDDGSVEAVSPNDLKDLCCRLGIEIKGVKVEPNPRGIRYKYKIVSVSTYQCAEQVTTAQVKLNALAGINLTINDGVLSRVVLDRRVVAPNFRLRISDHASVLSDSVLRLMQAEMNGHWDNLNWVTFVLDDKVEFTHKSLADGRFLYLHIRFDVSEVTKTKLLNEIYKVAISDGLTCQDLDKFLIDSPDRMELYYGLKVVSRYSNTNPPLEHIRDIVSDSRRVSDFVVKKFRTKFDKLLSSELVFTGYTDSRSDAEFYDFLKSIKFNPRQIRVADFDWLVKSSYMDIFRVLLNVSTIDNRLIRYFENYIRFFDVSDEYKGQLVNLVIRVCKWSIKRHR